MVIALAAMRPLRTPVHLALGTYSEEGSHCDNLVVVANMTTFCVLTDVRWSSWWPFRLCVWSTRLVVHVSPDSKVHGANMGPIWGRQDPGGSHIGSMKFCYLGAFL